MAISRQSRRIMVTVPVAVADTLERIRVRTGLAPTGFIRQVLAQSHPALEKMAEALEHATTSPDRVVDALRGAVRAAETQLQLLDAAVEEKAAALPKSPLGRKKRRRSGHPR